MNIFKSFGLKKQTMVGGYRGLPGAGEGEPRKEDDPSFGKPKKNPYADVVPESPPKQWASDADKAQYRANLHAQYPEIPPGKDSVGARDWSAGTDYTLSSTEALASIGVPINWDKENDRRYDDHEMWRGGDPKRFPSQQSVDTMNEKARAKLRDRRTAYITGHMDEKFGSQEGQPSGEGVPVKGRGLPQKYYSDRPRPSAEGEVPGRTDFLDEKQYTKRPKGQTLADKRAGRPVLNMFKAFGLHKDDVGGKNYGGGKLSPSSEKPEDQHPDEDKKKTPNGGENGD